MNRSMAQLRHLNPDMYKLINVFWRNEIGVDKLFKLKITLQYINNYLEDYLTQCKKRFHSLQTGELNRGDNSNLYIN